MRRLPAPPGADAPDALILPVDRIKWGLIYVEFDLVGRAGVSSL